MKKLAIAMLVSSAAAVGLARAEDAPTAKDGMTYARHLAEVAAKAHPEVVAVTVADGKSTTIGAYSTASAVGVTDKTPLKNVSGDDIGVIEITYAKAGDHAASDAAIRRYIAKRALSAKNLADPCPYDSMHSPNTVAQHLVDETMRAHPELLVFAIHATGPGEKTNIIIGSNIGRIGKAADEDDLRVIEKGSTNLEIAEGGERYEVELPLNDAKGRRIGALGTVFAYHAGVDKEALHKHAIAIRDALARKIPGSAALFKTHA